MLRLKISSPELGLVNSLFPVRRGVHTLATPTGKFRIDFAKFEAFEVPEFDEMTLLQYH
jgi:hypothetical protein